MKGVGIDVVDTARFAQQLDEPGSGFEAAVFTPAERDDARSGPGDPVLRLAARYAAKEAFVKAWSSSRQGFAPSLQTVDLLDIEVFHDQYRRPYLRFHGAVAAAFGGRTHVSLSHDGPVATAIVVVD